MKMKWNKRFVAIVMAMSMVLGSVSGMNLVAMAKETEVCTVEVNNSEELQQVLNGVGVFEGVQRSPHIAAVGDVEPATYSIQGGSSGFDYQVRSFSDLSTADMRIPVAVTGSIGPLRAEGYALAAGVEE